jgi:aconitate hydratase
VRARATAGPWLKYKGHLENIANNTLIGAVNADTGKVNTVVSQLTGKAGTVPGSLPFNFFFQKIMIII